MSEFMGKDGALGMAARLARPAETEVKRLVAARWIKAETEEFDSTVDSLVHWHALKVWGDGYQVRACRLISEETDYGKLKQIGICTDVYKDETARQAFWPLLKLAESTTKELAEIKRKWWYRPMVMVDRLITRMREGY